MQPRVHRMGRGVLAAEAMEQDGRVDAIHASAEFMRLLSPSRAAAGAADGRPAAAGAARLLVDGMPPPGDPAAGSFRSAASEAPLGAAGQRPGWLVAERRVSLSGPPPAPPERAAPAGGGPDADVCGGPPQAPERDDDAAAASATTAAAPAAATRVRRVSYILLPEEAAAAEAAAMATEWAGAQIPAPSGAELLPPAHADPPCSLHSAGGAEVV